MREFKHDDFWDYNKREYDIRSLCTAIKQLQKDNYYLEQELLFGKTRYRNGTYYTEEELREKISMVHNEYQSKIDDYKEKIEKYEEKIRHLNDKFFLFESKLEDSESENRLLKIELENMAQRLKDMGCEDKSQHYTPSRKIIKL